MKTKLPYGERAYAEAVERGRKESADTQMPQGKVGPYTVGEQNPAQSASSAPLLTAEEIDEIAEQHALDLRNEIDPDSLQMVEIKNQIIAAINVVLAKLACAEPVAWMWQHGETGNCGFLEACSAEDRARWERINNPRKIIAPLYALRGEK